MHPGQRKKLSLHYNRQAPDLMAGNHHVKTVLKTVILGKSDLLQSFLTHYLWGLMDRAGQFFIITSYNK